MGPRDPGYEPARLLFNPALPSASPQAVVYVETARDVGRTISWARDRRLRCVARSGGHSNAGYSTGDGLVIDIGRLNGISFDPATGTAVVGAGCRLAGVYDTLWKAGVTVPAGTCPTVGIGGLTLGGGLGMLSRRLGLTCDRLVQLEVVTASGEVLACNDRQHPDLFWASRGGGGGNFGIATSFTFKAHPVDKVSYFEVEWPWSDAGAVLNAWQDWAPQAPDELTSVCMAYACGLDPAGRPSPPRVAVHGTYLGPVETLNALLRPLMVGTPSRRNTGRETYQAATRRWAGPDADTTIGQPSLTRSHFVKRTWPRAAIDTILRYLTQRAESKTMTWYGGIELDACGGAMQRVSPEGTAFPHRDALFLCLYEANWSRGEGNQVAVDNEAWIRAFHAAMSPFAAGSYVNFTDPDLEHWPSAYYGGNLARLVDVKRAYDPEDFFHIPQSIPAGGGRSPKENPSTHGS